MSLNSSLIIRSLQAASTLRIQSRWLSVWLFHRHWKPSKTGINNQLTHFRSTPLNCQWDWGAWTCNPVATIKLYSVSYQALKSNKSKPTISWTIWATCFVRRIMLVWQSTYAGNSPGLPDWLLSPDATCITSHNRLVPTRLNTRRYHSLALNSRTVTSDAQLYLSGTHYFTRH